MYPISDTEVTMAASITCSSILNEVQLSNLNLKIGLSTFSAVIILKKTVLKHSNGISAISSLPSSILLQNVQQDDFKLSQKICNLNLEFDNLKGEKETALEECDKLELLIELIELVNWNSLKLKLRLMKTWVCFFHQLKLKI